MTSTTLSMTRNRAMTKSTATLKTDTLVVGAKLAALLGLIAALIATWRSRHQDRLILQRLDDHMLAELEIGRRPLEYNVRLNGNVTKRLRCGGKVTKAESAERIHRQVILHYGRCGDRIREAHVTSPCALTDADRERRSTAVHRRAMSRYS